MNDTTYGERLQDHSAAPRLCPDVYNADDYTYCRWATTVTGFDANSEQYVAVGVTCKRWGCPFCNQKKVRRLAYLSKEAKPDRLLTLTVAGPDKDGRPGRWEDPKDAWKGISAAFPELIRFARAGKASPRKQTAAEARAKIAPKPIPCECEYLRVLEIQKNGMPHFHCMLRSPFLLHSLMLDEWKRLIGLPDGLSSADPVRKQYAGVNIKKIHSSFRTFWYLVKYLTKLHALEFTARHVSYSKNFFNPADLEEVEYAKLEDIVKYDQHPWVFLRERYAWETVAVLDHGRWLLGGPPPNPYLKLDPKTIGLPGEPDPAPPPPMKQRLAPGLEAAEETNDAENLRPDGSRRQRARRKPNPARIDWPPPPTSTRENPQEERPF